MILIIDSMMTNNMKTIEFYNNRDCILNYANKDLLLKNNIQSDLSNGVQKKPNKKTTKKINTKKVLKIN
jgi:hypothetical protein